MNSALDDPRDWIRRNAIWPRIEASSVLRSLRDYDATVAGSWPIGLALPGADVDVICQAASLDDFARACRMRYRHMPSYREEHADSDPPAHLCRFQDQGLIFEVFGQDQPVREQRAYRHMLIEARLLHLGGARLRQAVLARKRQDLNTEAAFVDILGMVGNPFEALLQLEDKSDEKLICILNIHSLLSANDSNQTVSN